jgi:glycosyltransferase involved in cell wall biosynthesis
MGRVVVEAFCRGRAVVGARGGGIEDLVTHGENGLLFPSDDADGLARALVRVLSNRELASGLGLVAKAGSEQWFATPEEYAARVRALVTGNEDEER